MTFIHVYVKKGKVLHNYLHWRSVMRLFENFDRFKGKEKEFIFVDLDSRRVVSSQTCFRLSDVKKFTEGFECEEG